MLEEHREIKMCLIFKSHLTSLVIMRNSKIQRFLHNIKSFIPEFEKEAFVSLKNTTFICFACYVSLIRKTLVMLFQFPLQGSYHS